MNLLQFVALPGDQVTVCAQNKVSNGKVAFATAVQIIRERPDGTLRIYTDTRYQVDIDGVLIETRNYNTYTFSLDDVKCWFWQHELLGFSCKELHEIARMVKYAFDCASPSDIDEYRLLSRILFITEEYITKARNPLSYEPRRA
ncbi:hypothetical protein [Siphonobacter sp. SORGH_AS_0500]|uniref:hypothetical protein n=1 Tax=Siphonobacter sp. SORGH_AS_0500 TaxID=1864824 RepID=UPI00285D2135|nr:hypothetical protein [Siphonobacter sp. SORGH_AS_0500]MDR6195202.1 hypothetical protein [Siphonobacter sp. SORGH_AS_0500]